MIELNDKVRAVELKQGDLLYDPVKAGTHSQRVLVQWVGHHNRRNRTYVAGVEEISRDPVTLAYSDDELMQIYRHRS